jgi:hypothetical protein
MNALKNPFVLIVVLCLALLVAWQVPNLFTTETTSKSDSVRRTVTVSDLTVAGQLSRILSQYSPLLPDSQKGAIAQNYYGAPLDTEPQRHSVAARSVRCTTDSCTVAYSATQNVQIAGADAADLYKALRLAGIVEGSNSDASANMPVVSAESVTCLVDDAAVQGSAGNNIKGFTCTIETTQEVTQASSKIKRFEQCTFTNQGAEFFVAPCTVNALAEGVVTIGVSEGEESPANPFFYLNRGDTEVSATASWNGGVASAMKADVPLPGAWQYQGSCFVGEGWTLCFPEDAASILK